MLTVSQRFYLPLKRFIDFFGSTVGIVLLSPLLIVSAIITKLTSKGPILFKQSRLGKDEKAFTLYKFRSMRIDAPQISPENMTVEQQRSMTTNWGEIIRRTSIDEIPQLFNIWLGKMSFIGPRPSQTEQFESELVRARESFIPNAYEIKPGLSGYAQIHLHRDHDIMKKASDDAYYVKHMSLWFDIKLFIYSFFVLFGFTKGR
jgi:O-antigen biosynthesis protein WbqP